MVVRDKVVPSTVASRVQQVVLTVADRNTVDGMMTEADAPKVDLDQKAATVDRKADHRADVHKALRMADLAVIVAIVRDHLAVKAVQKEREEKAVLTAIVDRLDQKAKAVQSDVKLR